MKNVTTCSSGYCDNTVSSTPCATSSTVCTASATLFYTGLSFNATAWCATKPVGRFPDPSDTKCVKYVDCHFVNGTMYGQTYSCFGNTLFSRTLNYCVTDYTC